MKNFSVLILALVLVCVLVACGGDASHSKDDSSKVDSSVDSTSDASTDASADASADTSVETEPSEEPFEEPSEDVVASSKKGVINGNVYINEWAALTVTLPEGWSFQGDADLARISRIDTEKLAENVFDATLDEFGAVYCMEAYTNADDGTDVLIRIEKAAGELADLNEAEYIPFFAEGVVDIYPAYDYDTDCSTTQIGGFQYTVFNSGVSGELVAYLQRNYTRKIDGYFFTVTTSADFELGSEPLDSLFTMLS